MPLVVCDRLPAADECSSACVCIVCFPPTEQRCDNEQLCSTSIAFATECLQDNSPSFVRKRTRNHVCSYSFGGHTVHVGIEDRRIQKTVKLLREALVSLISEKPYDSIVIKEILDRANVGRSTFYMHFRDKDELLLSGIHEMLGPIPTATPSSGKIQE